MNSSRPPRVTRVALPVPLPQLFDYLPLPGSASPAPGVRVVVPFGKRKLVGIVIASDVDSEVPKERLLRLDRVLDDGEPLLDASVMGLM